MIQRNRKCRAPKPADQPPPNSLLQKAIAAPFGRAKARPARSPTSAEGESILPLSGRTSDSAHAGIKRQKTGRGPPPFGGCELHSPKWRRIGLFAETAARIIRRRVPPDCPVDILGRGVEHGRKSVDLPSNRRSNRTQNPARFAPHEGSTRSCLHPVRPSGVPQPRNLEAVLQEASISSKVSRMPRWSLSSHR